MEEDWGLFDAGWDIDELRPLIRELRPRRVVVDDAHLRGDRLAELRQLRREMNAEFAVVAVSWPGQVDEVAGALPGSSDLCGARAGTGPDPAGDRGGWHRWAPGAASAPRQPGYGPCGTRLDGLRVCSRECPRGCDRRSFAARHRRLVHEVAGPREPLRPRSARPRRQDRSHVGQVADALRVDTPRVVHLLRGLANGGTVDEASRYDRVTRLRVQPESLRYALVRDALLGGPAAMDVSDTIAHLDRPSIAVIPLIAAVHRGANVDRAFLLAILDRDDLGGCHCLCLARAGRGARCARAWATTPCRNRARSLPKRYRRASHAASLDGASRW